jgi:hypothetical protein
MTARKKNETGKEPFYSLILGEAEKLELSQALMVDGLDEEIALLRIRLRELARISPDKLELQLKAATVIAQLVKARYAITKTQKNSLKDAITKVITEIAVPLGIKVITK